MSDLSADECQARIDQFVQITTTDDAMAQFYLQDRNWDLESSVSAFLESNQSTVEERPRKKVKLDVPESLKCFLEKQINPAKKSLPEKLSIISWNIDGLDDRNINERTIAVAKIINDRKVDVAFLQEIIPTTYDLLHSKLSTDYDITKMNESPSRATSNQFYFTTLLMRRTTITLHSVETKPFDNSSMLRDLKIAKAELQNGMKLVLINTHLESTKDFKNARMEQLKKGLQITKEQSEDCTVIFAGDMNARDTEVAQVGIPNGIKDLWITLGQRKECEYTWDAMRNLNIQMGGKFKPRCRFDRVYFRASKAKDVTPVHFGLCGIEKVKGMQCFPSDHWGLYCLFDIKKN